MVVRKDGRQKTAIYKKVAWALTASLVAAPGIHGAQQGMGLPPTAHAAGEPREMVMYTRELNELAGLPLNHHIEVSSDALVLDDDDGKVTLQAEYAGTYTIYVYAEDDLETVLDEIRVTVKSHRNEADTDGDGLIDIAEIVAYLKLNPEVDLNHDGLFDHHDVQQMLGWINSKYAQANRQPKFIPGNPSQRYWLASATPSYDPEPILLDEFFEDEDGDRLSYQVQSVTTDVYADFKIINNALQYETRDPNARSHDITEVTIRATDEYGAYSEGQFTIERNVPPRFLDGTTEDVDLGTHYWKVENQSLVFTPIVLNLDDYFIDPNREELSYEEPTVSGSAHDLVKATLAGESPDMVISLISGINSELSILVTAEDPFGNSTSSTFTVTFRKEKP